MTKAQYVAVLERGPEGFGVFFPDLPGCVSAGSTMEEAIIGAREVLTLHIEGMVEDGLTVPKPSSMHVWDDEDFPDVAIELVFLVEANLPDETRDAPVRINVSLPEGLVAKIDAVANAHGMTRSGLLAVAARQWINSNPAAPADRSRNPLWLKGQRRRRESLTPST